jgi:hypothetical protein
MGLWTFLAIVAVIGILAESYNKRLKYQSKTANNQKEITELNEYIGKLEKRIENLEIIAVAEPDNFQDRTGMQPEQDADPGERNRKLVNDLARKKAGRY